jgi:2,3-bisphosphoglycerate-dependent phosphoglycerate mutase
VERLQGHLDSPLSAKGQLQVVALAERFQHIAVSALYSSDLGRAQQTAGPLAAATHLPVTLDARLRERSLGVFEGLTRDEAAQRYPDVYRVHRTNDADFEIPGGQSLRAHATQVLEAVHDIANRHLGQTVVLVTHGGALSAIFRACVGVPLETPRAFSLPNAGINLVELTGDRLKLVTWGDTLHLKPAG